MNRLITNGTVDPCMAGILSYLKQPRYSHNMQHQKAGKDSLLPILMFKFLLSQEILTIEDIELPGAAMRALGFKVQTIW